MNDRELQPPSTYTVDFERKTIIYQADGKPLIRPVGFTAPKPQEDAMGKKKGPRKGGY